VWFDSHCHLDFPEFDSDRDAVWQRARSLGVEEAFVPGVLPEQWSELGRVAHSLPGARVGIGIHPRLLADLSEAESGEALARLPEAYERVGAVAVGECGLDARATHGEKPDLTRQLAVLEPQLKAARELDAPLVLHVVSAHGPALELLQRFGPFPAGGVVHSYSGPLDLVPRYARLGLSFGFSAAVCRERAPRVHSAVRAVPAERLLLETDAPDQLPRGERKRGRTRTEPSDLLLVAGAVAKLRGVELEELARITTENARALFAKHAPKRATTASIAPS
jgi:TatD DNase family protein